MIDWLPELVLLEDASGIWEVFLEIVYGYYQDDFIFNEVSYKNVPVHRRRYPISEGKEKSFWHLVSSGDIEESRNIEIPRCERIRWPRPIIECDILDGLWIWRNFRKSEERLLIYIPEERYLVVLGIRRGYYLLCTAYCIEETHRHNKLQQEYLEYIRKNS